jgi:cytochrome c551/c552
MHKLWVGLFLISNLAAIPLVGANEALMDKAGCVACHRIDIK